jgi:hypothetical protein
METKEQYQEWLKARKKGVVNFTLSGFCVIILFTGLYLGANNKLLMAWLTKYYIVQLLALFAIWRALYMLPFITANIRRNHRLDR